MPALTFSELHNGPGATQPLSLGAAPNGGIANSPKVLFLRHDQTLAITNVGFFISAYTGAEVTAAEAAANLEEIRDWGDANTPAGFGGVQINQDAAAGFPDASWPAVGFPNGTTGNGARFNRSQGMSSTESILLRTSSRATATGQIPATLAGVVPNISVQFRVRIPDSVTTPGVRFYSLRVSYTFTS